MIELVDQYIEDRLKIITMDGQDLRVYEYDPERDHEEMKTPCAAFRRTDIDIGVDDARPNEHLYTASAEETEITVPLNMGGGTLTGPVSYTRKPYPVPVDLIYEIQARATNRTDAIKLIESIYVVIPPGHTPQISGQFPLFVHGPPLNLDELERPLFVSGFMLYIHDLWVDRFEAETYQSIRSIILEGDSLS